MDFQMSSETRAIQAVVLLRAAGHAASNGGKRRTDSRKHVIHVAARDGTDYEATRLVHVVDPDAQVIIE